MALRGAPELRARLRALKVAFKPVGRTWAEKTRDLAKASAPRRTGKGAASIRVRNASMTKASVGAMYYMHILDRGAKAYDIRPRKARTLVFQASGRTIFAKKVHKPAQSGTGFATKAAETALRQTPMLGEIIKAWNAAA